MTNPLPTVPVHAIDPQPDAPQWLVRDLWTTAAVGVIGGSPKVGKSWFGLDLAVSVASGTPALGRFPVDATGPALVYLAEDALPRVRDRVSHLCRHRGLDLARLDLQVVTADRLRLDTERDQLALDQTVQRIRPALLLLDPLVRLHSLDENSASDISSLLAFLRAINRRYHLALILVHHMAKRSSRNLGQSLRGSSDLHAWTDSACYLVRRPDDRLQLNLPSSTAPLPLPTPSCCASQAAATSPSRCSSTARTPRRHRSPRRSAPLSAAPASRSPGPSCANACASTTLVSVSPSKLSNNAASPSAAPTAGTCRHDPYPRLPARSHPAAVPLFHRSAPGTRSERNDHRHTPRHLSCNQPRPGARNATAR